jgi:two-component system sensor histidine kinase/response regulator
LSLIGANVIVIRSVRRPLCTLSAAAKAVGRGDLGQQVHLTPNTLTIGEGDELGLLVDSFNEMTDDLRERYADLVRKVEARAAGLAIAADIARVVSSSLELEVILRESAQIIAGRLGHVCPGVHHVGIFLVDEGSDIVVLKEVAGEAKGTLDKRSFRVPVGSKSPVGLAVATRQLQTIQNVKVMATHLKPPLLLDAYSAVAVPLQVGDTRIGALDVQSRRSDAFPSDTRQLLNMLANQIATAVQNARLYQQERKVAQHLAEVDQLKTQFLTMISHKLRAPLSTIAGLSGNLLEESNGSITDQQERDVSLIHSLGQYLLELTDDFLDISKMKADAITLNLEDVNMRLLIESTLDAVAPLIEDRPITLSAEIDSDLPVVYADKRRVRQVMINLLSNAATFTESGRIGVRARNMEALNVDMERMEPFVEVRISSTGLNILEEKLTAGLWAFNRPDSSPVPSCVAAGFGLPVTEALIDLHGGRIWVDSKPGEGTTFTFMLPIDRSEAENHQLAEKGALDSVEGV